MEFKRGAVKCKQCEGDGKIPWPTGWRPYEQEKRDGALLREQPE
jgi:hypothetical protein